jgi:hypothetical protein
MRSVVEKKSKIKNKINERIGKASQFYYLVMRLLRNKAVDRQYKITICKIYILKTCCCMELREMDMY